MSLDPQLVELRRSLGRFRRRVWLRRVVRDGSLILAAVAAVELALAVIARLMPFDLHLAASVAVVIVGLVVLAVDIVRVRPTLAEAALAVGLRGRAERSSLHSTVTRGIETRAGFSRADVAADATQMPIARTRPSTSTSSVCSAATR